MQSPTERQGVRVTRVRVTLSSHPTFPKHSLTLYCLWSCFIMASYMHIIEACSTQAAWLRWNVWIIYQLQSAFATLTKFSQQSRKIINVIYISKKEGRTQKSQNQTGLVLCLFFGPVCLVYSCTFVWLLLIHVYSAWQYDCMVCCAQQAALTSGD